MKYKIWGKGIFDYSLAIILVIPFSVLIIVFGTLNFLSVGLPVFFNQPRVGRNGKIFKIYKLRTMVGTNINSEFASSETHRITQFGNFLRKTRIDELPQIINVLKGEMSFIGPRPEQPDFVKRYCEIIDDYNHRHFVKPGITGLAQVENGYTDSDEGTKQKLKFDLLYIQKLDLKTDLKIIYKTFFEVVRMTG
ncbi:MAG: sugar transferase [Rhizobiales bacterium]|nr:sugar transferase [Hyphomicrobiales bacterium]NRB14954.1 sugar transferase [Hyphomicrobiales bacterium]